MHFWHLSFKVSNLNQLATRTRRFFAAILDIFMLVIATTFVLLVSGLLETAEAYRHEYGVTLRILAAGTIAYLVLNGYLLVRRSQTIGKWALGLVVINSGSQSRAEAWRVLVRAIMNPCFYGVIGGVFAYLIFLDPVSIFLKQRRCLHDWIFQTDVIRINRESN